MKQDEEIRMLNAKIDHAELQASSLVSGLEVHSFILFDYLSILIFFLLRSMVKIICRLLSHALRGMNWKI